MSATKLERCPEGPWSAAALDLRRWDDAAKVPGLRIAGYSPAHGAAAMVNATDAVGGAVVGTAIARALARRGHRVLMFDAGDPPAGASIRNFGTLWPIGRPAGERRRPAHASLVIWREVLHEAGARSTAYESLHVAHHADNWAYSTRSRPPKPAMADDAAC